MTVDAPGDARAFTFDQQAQFVPAPQEAAVDITRTVAALGHRRLSVTVHFRDLQVRPRHTTLVRVGTPRLTFDVIAERMSASRATVEVSDRGDTAFECRGLRVSYDGAADLVSLSVPTSCLEAPRWVQLGVRATASPEANPEIRAPSSCSLTTATAAASVRTASARGRRSGAADPHRASSTSTS